MDERGCASILFLGLVWFGSSHYASGGPICFRCDRTYNPELCRESVTCGDNQVCSVQEVYLPHGDVYFWSGCEDTDTCSTLAEASVDSSVIIGKRQEPVQNHCAYCCDTDLCNRNCTSFVNLARDKPAYQSSVAYNGTPDLAVDGNTEKNYYKDGRSFHIKVLVSNVNATQLDRNSPLFTQCGYYYGHSSDGNTVTIDCPVNTAGRWIRVQQSDPNFEYMHLCEVEVFGF